MQREGLVHDAATESSSRKKTDRTGRPPEGVSLGAALEGGRTPVAPATVLRLQRTAGNTAVTTLVQRWATAGDEEQVATSPVLDVVGKGGGNALKPELQEEMEARLGSDFSDVRVHQDGKAAESAAAVSARAYTVQNEIVLGKDAPDLESAEGKRTLAHELTHVVQQREGPVAGTPTGGGISVSDPSDRFEKAAEENAERVMADSQSTGPVQRQEEEAAEEETEEEA